MRKTYILVLLGLTLLSYACKDQGASKTNTKDRSVACTLIEGLKEDALYSCGQLEVPENHNDPEGNKITITYVLIPAKDRNSTLAPIIYLTGGPGGQALSSGSVEAWMKDALREKRAIILFDQRGIGYSSALKNINKDLFAIFRKNLTPEEERKEMETLISDYVQASKDKKVQLPFYNSFENAKDVGLLMEHLGYDKYNLFGGSYGTRLARVIQELFPEKLNAVILNSPNPIKGDFLLDRLSAYSLSLQRVMAYCKKDSLCNASFPNLEVDYNKGIKALVEQPLEIEILDEPYYLNAHEAVYFVRRLLYRNDAREKVPALIQEYLNGGGPILEDLATKEFRDSYNYAMWLTVERNEMYDLKHTEDVIRKRYEELPLFPAELGFFTSAYLEMKNLHQVTLAKEAKEFEMSEVPTFITVNQFDPVTPPENGEIMMRKLSMGQLYILDEGGHGGGNAECRDKLMIAFMDDPSAELDISCLNLYEN